MRSSLGTLVLSAAMLFALVAPSRAQCTPVAGTGCGTVGAPTCVGIPVTFASFSMVCPSFGGACIGTPMLVFGTCNPLPAPIPPPIGCGTCLFGIATAWGTAPDPLDIGPGLPAFFQFCVHCACIGTQQGVPCVALSQATVVTVLF